MSGIACCAECKNYYDVGDGCLHCRGIREFGPNATLRVHGGTLRAQLANALKERDEALDDRNAVAEERDQVMEHVKTFRHEASQWRSIAEELSGALEDAHGFYASESRCDCVDGVAKPRPCPMADALSRFKQLKEPTK